MATAPTRLLQQVPLFSGLPERALTQLAASMKERTFAAGDTIAREGEPGVGFFVIEEGVATVTRNGSELTTLGPGDYFGELALIAQGPRTATVTADTRLRCYGLAAWEFRPFVEGNAQIAWKLLETVAKRIRNADGR